LEKIRLINHDGSQLGIMSKMEACNIAKKEGLDIVEISSKTKPPVFKIIDLGKFKYKQKKKQKQKKQKLKNIKFRPNIGINDRDIKINKINKFIHNGDKVKIIINYRGREINSINFKLMDSILENIKINYNIESKPRLDGNNIITIIY